MTISLPRSPLSEPVGDNPVSDRTFGYVSAYTRQELHGLVLKAFREAGISQVTLAKRMGKRPEQISRLLAAPGNWTIDTAAELLFAIDGSLTRIERRWPLKETPTNSWSASSDIASSGASSSASSRASSGTAMVTTRAQSTQSGRFTVKQVEQSVE